MVEINLKELFKATVNGTELSIADMGDIAKYYQACCIAEYIEDNYVVTTVEAIDIGYEVKRLQDKYDMTEEIAVDTAIRKYALERRA